MRELLPGAPPGAPPEPEIPVRPQRHPAENLLRPDDGGKWRGATAGEKQLSVVLELGDTRPIHSLHIGNDGAAFVEVLLGCSAGGEFQVRPGGTWAHLGAPGSGKMGQNCENLGKIGENLEKNGKNLGKNGKNLRIWAHLGTP
uniref:DNA-repair protein Xrcc1 N-terminal domain-containing protein n=1 Tax=Junco hyemalis TaxID=40217 RepID=A0A8C5J5C6_JUNHY